MDELVTVDEIINRIKKYLIPHMDKRPLDQDVAGVLRVDNVYLASIKKRNNTSLILPNVLQFCRRTGVDPMKILF